MKPTALFCADLHIRLLAPKCREQEEFEESMFSKLGQLNIWQHRYKVPLVVVGDVGNIPEWPNILLTKMLPYWYQSGCRRIVIPGQHDLPEHRLNQWMFGALGLLHGIGAIEVVIDREEHVVKWGGITLTFSACPYGEDPLHIMKEGMPNILLIHKLIIDDLEEKYLGSTTTTARSMLNKFTEYDLIVSGDNHKPFVMKKGRRLLVNCGSMMRTRIDQVDHKPRAYLWYAETNTIEPLFFKIKRDVIKKVSISGGNSKERMNTYVKYLSKKVDLSLSYEHNLKQILLKNKTDRKVEKKIWRYVNG